MPKGLVRHQQAGHLHFITISCYRHTNILGTPAARNILQQILEETRQRYRFSILGYVFMSNHIHLLVTEPGQATLIHRHSGHQATLLPHPIRGVRLGAPLP